MSYTFSPKLLMILRKSQMKLSKWLPVLKLKKIGESVSSCIYPLSVDCPTCRVCSSIFKFCKQLHSISNVTNDLSESNTIVYCIFVISRIAYQSSAVVVTWWFADHCWLLKTHWVVREVIKGLLKLLNKWRVDGQSVSLFQWRVVRIERGSNIILN